MAMDTFKNDTLLVDRIINSPINEHTILLNNHFLRYNKAMDSLKITNRDIVLDASCGLGYGSYILAQKAKAVIGLDINPDYVKLARRYFPKKNLHFFLYKDFPKNKNRIDKIICIETYEHLAKRETAGFLKMILRFLKQGGDMFITAPLGNNKASRYNKYHLNEPSLDVLYKYFAGSFENIEFETGKFKNSFGYQSKYCFLTLKNYSKKKL